MVGSGSVLETVVVGILIGSNYLRLLKLSTDVQIAVRDNLISMGHARALVMVEDELLQNRVVKQIIQDSLSVRQTEALVKKLLSENKTPKTRVKITLSDEVRNFHADWQCFAQCDGCERMRHVIENPYP